MKPVPLFATSIAGKSFVVSRQRRLNCYEELRPDGDKTKIAIYGTPGMLKKFAIPGTAPVRGFLGTPSALYAVAGFNFYQLNASGSPLFTGSVPSSSTVSMAYQKSQLVFVDGTSGYFYNGSTLQVLSGGFPSGARTCTFVAGFFVAESPGTQQFFVSNAYDGSTWNALAFASASQYSDNLLAVDNLGGLLILFSELHQEFWQNTGGSPQPFAPILSATTEWGLAAIFSRAHVGQSIVFLAQTREGGVQICQITGYSVSVVSNSDLDSILNSLTKVSDAVALSYQVDQRKFYQITFPTDDRSFLLDVTSGAWSETQTGLTSKYATRHTGQFSTLYAGQTIISDWQNQNIYVPSVSQYTDNGTTILRELITRHVEQGFNEFSVDEVYLDMESGVGLQSGQGSAPVISMECSRDGGRTFETPVTQPMGAVGQYWRVPPWRRNGSFRDCVLRFRMTDPVKFVIAGGALSIRERPQ